MSHRNLIIITKIVLFYSLFYVVMKAIVIFGGAWIVPNLLLMVPYLILAGIGWMHLKRETYSWWYVGIGAAVIILTRIYERDLAVWIQQLVVS